MATRVVEDLIAGGTLVEDEYGITCRRVFNVYNIVPAGNKAGSRVQFDALNAIDTTDPSIRVPAVGEAHPTVKTVAVVRKSVDRIANSATQAKVTVEYEGVSNNRILMDVRVNGISQMAESSFDLSGAILWTGYKENQKTRPLTPPNPRGYDSRSETPCWEFNIHRVPKLLPDTTYDVTVREPTERLIAISGGLGLYRRSLNEKAWSGGYPDEWLCTAINMQPAMVMNRNITNFQQKTVEAYVPAWIVTYCFRFKPGPRKTVAGWNRQQAWRPMLIFKDQTTQTQPLDIDPLTDGWPDISSGNGWKWPIMYPSRQFSNLELPELWDV